MKNTTVLALCLIFALITLKANAKPTVVESMADMFGTNPKWTYFYLPIENEMTGKKSENRFVAMTVEKDGNPLVMKLNCGDEDFTLLHDYSFDYDFDSRRDPQRYIQFIRMRFDDQEAIETKLKLFSRASWVPREFRLIGTISRNAKRLIPLMEKHKILRIEVATGGGRGKQIFKFPLAGFTEAIAKCAKPAKCDNTPSESLGVLIISHTIEDVKAAIACGAPVNMKGLGGKTPLDLAVTLKNIEAVNVLIAAGADVNARDALGFAPIHNAASLHAVEADGDIKDTKNKKVLILKALIAAGADVNAKDVDGRTPLDHAQLDIPGMLTPFPEAVKILKAASEQKYAYAPQSNKMPAEADSKKDRRRSMVLISTSQGDIKLELYEKKAPITVANFLSYVEEGFFDGTIFHRVINNFMIQGGGFSADMKQKPTKAPIKNEADNGLKNDRGTIVMARTAVVDSATSQFFINHRDNTFLNHGARDFGYAVFGKVVEGIEVVDKIAAVKTRPGDVPVETVSILSIKTVN